MERDFPRPALLAVLALITGRVLAWSLGTSNWALPLLMLALAAAVGIARRHSGHGRALSLSLGFLAAGLATQVHHENIEQVDRSAAIAFAEARFVQVSGVVEFEPRHHSQSVLLWLEAGARLSADGRETTLATPLPVQTHVTANARSIAPGDHFQGLGRATSVEAEASHAGWERWLDSRGAVVQIRVVSWEARPPAAPSPWLRYRRAMARLADSTEAMLSDNLSDDSAALLSAMMLARTGGLSDEQRAVFQRAGLMHLFAVSGLHAGLIAGLIVLLGAIMGFGPRGRALVVLVGLVLFCTLTGFRSSVLRAALLVGVFMLQPLVRREVEPLSALSSIALILLLLRPRALWQLDFQLSFLCALTLVFASPGVIAIQEHLGPRLGWKLPARVLIRWLQVAFASGCIQLALAPVLASQFGIVSLIAPIANAVILPFVAPLLGAGFACALLSPAAPEIAAGMMGFLDWPATAIELAASLFAALPSCALEGLAPWPTLAVGLFYLILIAGRWIRLRRSFLPIDSAWSAGFTAAFALAFLIWLPIIHSTESQVLRITYLDVGQGDAVLIQTGDGVTMLVDTGPERGQTLVRELRARGVERLDILALTHADADHVGGAPAIIESLRPGRLLVGGSLAETAIWQSVAHAVDKQRIPVAQVARGAVIQLDPGIHADILHPTPDFLEEGDGRNAASIVMRLTVGDLAFLLTGDADFDSERDMLTNISEAQLRATVLQAGHHGSASSTSLPFLAAVRPAHALISCGRNNRYGHPAPDVLARLAEMGVQVWRTDRHGSVSFEADGENVWLRVERVQEVSLEPLG